MARYPNGQPVRISTTVRDLTGALVNAGTISLTVQKPDATTQTYTSPANDGTGLYHQDIPAADINQIGHYAYAWTSTGTGAGVAPGDFDVYDPFEVAILPLQDAKDSLNIPQGTTTYDNEIARWTASIQSSLERFTGGPIITRAITERAEMMANQTVITVRQRPLVSVTSITSASGSAIDISGGLDLDVNAGTVRRKLGLPFYGPFWSWLPQVTIAYTAGWGTAVPAAFADFASIVIQHLWETQRGPAALPMVSEETISIPGFGYAIPNRAAELLNGSLNGVPFCTEAYA